MYFTCRTFNTPTQQQFRKENAAPQCPVTAIIKFFESDVRGEVKLQQYEMTRVVRDNKK